MQFRHKQVVQHIKNKHFEQGVGILEGMTDDFPERSGVFREQIGDIRMMQKDYRSAIWNYRQAMEIDPLKIEIKNKIVKVETLQNRQHLFLLPALIRNGLFIIIYLVAVRHIYKMFTVMSRLIRRRHDAIGEQVIEK
jgi:hypothetical protein